jgi:hypothetical protein
MTRLDSASEPIAIACTLDAESLGVRAEEWREFVASSVMTVESDDTTLRLELHDSETALVSAALLGAREKQCCAFFDVVIEITADHRALRFSVPVGAEQALASLVSHVNPRPPS